MVKWDARKIIEDELNKQSIFKNRESLMPEYIPEALPHRENELKLLASYFRHLIANPGSMSQRVLIVGRVGTGKTTLMRTFATNLTSIAREKGLSFDYIHVNCYKNRSLFGIVRDIALQLGLSVPHRGLSSKEIMDAVISFLDEGDRYTLIVFDDFHYFVNIAGKEAVYFITRAYEAFHESKRLNMVFVSTDINIIGVFDPVTESYLNRYIIKLQPYTSSQLLDILRYRASLAFHEDAYDEKLLELIAEYEGVDRSGEGNARHALTILLTAGDIAEKEGAGRISIEHVRKAITIHDRSKEIERVNDVLRYSSLHELLLLLSIIRLLRKKNDKEVEMGEVEDEYRLLCNIHGEIPRSHTQLYEYTRNLSKTGVINAVTKNMGNRGRTTLISIPYGPLEELEKYVTTLVTKKREIEY